MKKAVRVFWVAAAFLLLSAAAAHAAPFKLAAVFQSNIEEPWCGAIYKACLAFGGIMGKDLVFEYEEKVSAADFERVLRGYASRGFDLIVGDAFLTGEEAVRRVAKEYPKIAFAFGSEFSHQAPNLSVFGNWIHEPSYLCGVIAGRMTNSNRIGAVAAMPIPAVNRLLNAFKLGALSVNPKVKVAVAYIGSRYDPPKAKKTALAQIETGVDLIFAERLGVFEAAREKKIPAFGNMIDQNALAPDVVITGPVWDMTPTIEYCITEVQNKTWKALDLRKYSMMTMNGASLAPFHNFAKTLPASLIREVRDLEARIRSGELVIPIIETELKSD